MTTLHAAVIEFERLEYTASGEVYTRAYILEGVGGNLDRRVPNAINDNQIPNYGAPHKTISGIFVTNITADMMDTDKARVVVKWSRPGTDDEPPFNPDTDTTERGTVTLSSKVRGVERDFDINNNPLKVAYTGTVVDSDGNALPVDNEVQVATLDIELPMMTITFSRRESGYPLGFAESLTGSINRDPIGPFGAETLLFVGLEATSDDGGETTQTHYEFQHNRDGWKATVRWIDKETDRHPPDAKIGNGFEEYDVYPKARFGALNLPWNAPELRIVNRFEFPTRLLGQ